MSTAIQIGIILQSLQDLIGEISIAESREVKRKKESRVL